MPTPGSSRAEQPAEGVVELRLERISQLFDSFDPFPLPTRDLSPAAEAFIVDWARELPRDASFRLRLHVSYWDLDAETDQIRLAISKHFSARAESKRRDRNELLRIGRRSLAIGLATLALGIALQQLIQAAFGRTPAAQFAGEALLLLGSVANWRPLEIFLYDWWPIDRQRRLLQRLAGAELDLAIPGG
jgi:hypothetical protein